MPSIRSVYANKTPVPGVVIFTILVEQTLAIQYKLIVYTFEKKSQEISYVDSSTQGLLLLCVCKILRHRSYEVPLMNETDFADYETE